MIPLLLNSRTHLSIRMTGYLRLQRVSLTLCWSQNCLVLQNDRCLNRLNFYFLQQFHFLWLQQTIHPFPYSWDFSLASRNQFHWIFLRLFDPCCSSGPRSKHHSAKWKARSSWTFTPLWRFRPLSTVRFENLEVIINGRLIFLSSSYIAVLAPFFFPCTYRSKIHQEDLN